MNALKVTFLLLVLTGLFVAVGYLLGGRQGMIIAFGLAVVMNFASYWFSDKIVLAMYRARPATEQADGKLIRIVRMTTQRANLPMPKVYIIPTQAPNAFATGRNKDHAAVAVTEGILGILSGDELEGVIGHELAHVRNRDILLGSVVATIAGAIGILATMARWGAIFGGFGGRSDERGGGNPLVLLAVAIVAPLAALVVQTAISRSREYKADRIGASISGKPLALASALEKLHRAPVRLNLDQRPATAHLFIANPLSGRGIANLFSTHPPYQERIKRLQALTMTGMPLA
ncbi:MAG: zinc metalloprotease HtpX [candidate division Zixibacteria bacterium]|nr:zinc metalloprotease HtpX [candidate division Zixibacteria bacterium]